MAVVSKHVNANLQFNNTQRKTVQRINRTRSNIASTDVELIRNAIQDVQATTIGGVFMTLTTQLVEE